VRTAEQTRQLAPATPEADHHLKLAREELSAAHRALDDGHDRRAEMLFIRARTDAELSQALALSTKAENEKRDLQTELQKVKSTPLDSSATSSLETSQTIQTPANGTVEYKSTTTTTKKTEIKKTPKVDEQARADEPTPAIPDDQEEHAENNPHLHGDE